MRKGIADLSHDVQVGVCAVTDDFEGVCNRDTRRKILHGSPIFEQLLTQIRHWPDLVFDGAAEQNIQISCADDCASPVALLSHRL